MNETEVSSWSFADFRIAAGVVLGAIGVFIVNIFRTKAAATRASEKQARADQRVDFTTIVERLDSERAAVQAQVELLKVRIAKLEHDHANCELANRALRDMNASQQREINELKRQVAELTKPK